MSTRSQRVTTSTVPNGKGSRYVLLRSQGLARRRGPDPLVDVFTGEADARDVFLRLRLQAGSGAGWALLVALDGEAVRPLCWFGFPPEQRRLGERPPACPSGGVRRAPRRWAVVVASLVIGALLWAMAAGLDRAGAAVAPDVSRTPLVTVTDGQRAEATAVNDSDACHRIEIVLIDGDGRPVASNASTVCPGKHLAVAYRPPTATRLRSVVAMRRASTSIADPYSHGFEVQDIATGRASIALRAPAHR